MKYFSISQVALVGVDHPREHVHVRNHLALFVVDDFAIGIAIGKSIDFVERAAFGNFFAGEIKFFAADPIDGCRRLQRLGRKHRGVCADETDFDFGVLLLDRFGDFAIVLQRRRRGVDDDVIVPAAPRPGIA